MRFLVKHVGNMGDMIFFIPPALATLKKKYPDSHITLVTAWGFKDKRGRYGKRNQGGFCISLMMTNPHIDQLVQWHDTKLSLEGAICEEEGRAFPTWNAKYYEEQKKSGNYDGVFELDFGLAISDDPIQKVYERLGMPNEHYSDYKLYLTEQDREVAHYIIENYPRPRIVLLESLQGPTTRHWDPGKIPALAAAIKKKYNVTPIWFGARFTPEYHGRQLTLRENIALLTECDVAIGPLSGSLHMAAAVGLPTLTLYCDHPLHRAAPNYFLNSYISNEKKKHRTLWGVNATPMEILKSPNASPYLTPAEKKRQRYKSWLEPGYQPTKSGLAVITVDEVMEVMQDML